MMDALTPLLILAAKNASEDVEKDAKKSKSYSLPVAFSVASAVGSATLSATYAAISAGFFPLLFGSSKAESKDKPKNKQEDIACDTNPLPSGVDEKLIEAVVGRIRSELPTLIESINNTPSQAIVSETYDAVYTSQIIKAQEFLNENHSADLSRVKCLLHRLLPREYFDQIEQLREHQNPQNIINIHGGQNIIAPKAEQAEQHIEK